MFTLPLTLLQLAPWEYVVCLVGVQPDPLPSELTSYQAIPSSLPSIVTYNYSSVLTIQNDIQQVSECDDASQ